MTDREYIHWFAFRAAIGKQTKNQMIMLGLTPEQIFHMSKEEAKQYVRADKVEAFLKSQDMELSMRDLDWVERNKDLQNVRTIYYTDKDYPQRLLDIPDMPLGLYVKGALPDDDMPSVAMVGARDATPYGIQAAEYFSKELASSGVSIVSGLARGIDACSHRGALKCTYGQTFGVLGSGIDVVYPRSNGYLYDEMAERGGIISEYLPGTQPLGRYFPLRNRIISGLSDAVFIIEARKKSGTMITADQANEQGRDVFCLPGRYYDALSYGCMELIGSGAKLVYSPEQILEEIHAGEQLSLSMEKLLSHDTKKDALMNKQLTLTPTEAKVYQMMGEEAIDVDTIVARTGLSVTDVLTAITMLELNDQIISYDHLHYCIKK